MPGPTLKRNDRGIYEIHWSDAGRSRRLSTRARDLAAAKSYLGTWLLMERSASPGKVALTVADCWTIYDRQHVQKRVMSPSTRVCWKALGPYFGEMAASSLTQDAVDRYVTKRTTGKLGRKVKPSTCRRELSTLCAALRHNKIAVDVELPEAGAPRDRWLRADEIQKLMQAAEGSRKADGKLARAERFLWLALETAGRRSAVFDLTWDRVDFETGVVHLAVPGRRVTKKRRASVPMSRPLRKLLERADAERTGPRSGAERVVGGSINAIAYMVEAVAKRAGLPGVTPNVLRHTAATNMARRGVPLWLIAKVLGNSVGMVEKVYAKHSPEDLQQAVGMISNGALEAAE